MGNWFSKPDTSKEDEQQKKGEEYQKAMQTLKQQEEELYNAAQEAAAKKKETLEQSLKRQKEISAKRMKEMEDTIKRAKELKDARRLLNVQASQLLCALYYNYQFGDIDEDPDKDWGNNVVTVVDECLNVESFWLLCKVPQLLPLLWATGSECDNFHIYEKDVKGEVNLSSYKILINTNIESYVGNILPNYLTSVCQSNCKKYTDFNEERNNEIGTKCKQYLTETENVLNDSEWFKKTMNFLKDDDKMNWKCFAARSGKGICSNEILLVPSTYPKLYPKYELYESLLMLTNTVINHYGDLRNEDGTKVSPGSTGNFTNGGKCFNINESITKNTFDKGIDMNNMWDGETYINVNSIVLNSTDVTGVNDDSWMENTLLYDKMETYGQNADGKGGFLKYINPTQKYTRQFINDENNVEVAFQMPRLSAGIDESFTKNFLKNILNALQQKDYQFYNVFASNNKELFTSIDYLYITPKGFEQVDNVSPIARYIFEILVQHSCKWYLTFPVENTMSMSKINYNILLYDDGKDKKILPQYIWTKSKNIEYSVDLDKTSSNLPKIEFENIEPENYDIK